MGGRQRGPAWRWMAIIVAGAAFCRGPIDAQNQEVPAPAAARFSAVDIYLDSGATPLAAYQLEFTATAGDVRIVGVEGGAHAAFREAPFYDPRAMQRERVVLAAFNTAETARLPSGRTRVATIHVRMAAGIAPAFVVKLHTAADAEAKTISCETTFEPRTENEK